MQTPFESTGLATSRAAGETFLSNLAAAEPGVTLQSYGSSVNGNPMTAATVGSGPVRVCVLGAIHGDEPAGREAAFAYLRDLAETSDPLLTTYLSESAWSFMPTGNPDRIDAGVRQNINGIDLNRDHYNRTQPETQAIHSWLRACDPVLILDLHETSNPTVTDTAWGITTHAEVHIVLRSRAAVLKDAVVSAFSTAGHGIVAYPGDSDTEGTMRTESGRVHSAVGLLVETWGSSGPLAQRVGRHILALQTSQADHETRTGDYLYAHQLADGSWVPPVSPPVTSGLFLTSSQPVIVKTSTGVTVVLTRPL